MAGVFTHNGNIVEGLPSNASMINYNNTSSGMLATQVQDAVDELHANKQPKTDNNLTTTNKTITGGINELKSGLTNYQAQNDINLEVPDRKNLLNYDEWKKVNIIGGSGIFENNGITLTATDDCYTGYNNTDFPVNARIPISEGETITLSWQANNDLSGIQYIFPNGRGSGAVSKNNANGKSLSYTANSGVTYVTFRFGVGDVGNSIEYSNIQIEKGSVATEYTPYIPSVESRLEAVESKQNVFSVYATANKWYKIATKTINTLVWIYHSSIIAVDGAYIKHCVFRSNNTNGFANNDTKINAVYGSTQMMGMVVSNEGKRIDLYFKAASTGTTNYTVLTDGQESSILYFDPVETNLTDADMTKVG